MARVFWILLGLAVANFGALGLWARPRLVTLSGGPDSLDGRFAGYDLADVETLFQGLGDAGIAFYLGPFQSLDTTFPALLGATLVLGLALRLGHWNRYARLLVVTLAGLYVVFDYTENAAVRDLLLGGVAGLTEANVGAASTMTVAKWASLVVPLFLLLALLVRGGLRRWSGKA